MKHHAFGFEPEALFEPVLAWKRNLSTSTQHTMPWKTARCAAQRPGHLTRATRETGRTRDIAVGGYLAFGDRADYVTDNFEHD